MYQRRARNLDTHAMAIAVGVGNFLGIPYILGGAASSTDREDVKLIVSFGFSCLDN